MSEKIDNAMELFKAHKYKEAIDAFSLVLENEPDNASVYNNMAVAYSCLADFEHAENYFVKALDLDPQLAQGYINLSDLYFKAGDIASAIGTLQKGSYELEDNLTIAHLLARVYIEDQRFEDAIVELERVLDGEPENYDAYYDLGHVYFELGDYEGAISNFETVTEYKEDSELLFYSLAQAYEANNEIDKAISNYLKSIAVNSKFVMPYKKVGILFMARGDYEDAIEYFEDYSAFDIPEEEKISVNKLIERIKAKA
ncbi:MAG: tetratricopeptide repeat protein [bacterium]|nr:tetratricopeptide repeat protein [bacterium]